MQAQVTVGKSYPVITISPDATLVSMPAGFDQPIKPGTFGPAVTQVFTGHAFTHELEPGVIHEGITHLFLGTDYEHPFNRESIPDTVENLYIFDTNRDLAPTDRPFYLYKKDNDGACEFTKEEKTKWDIEKASYHTASHEVIKKTFIGVIYKEIVWAYLITPIPQPDTVVTAIVPKQVDLGQVMDDVSELKTTVSSIKSELIELQQSKKQVQDLITKLEAFAQAVSIPTIQSI